MDSVQPIIYNALNVDDLYATKLQADIKFALTKRNGDEVVVRAHKAMLSSKSPVFTELFGEKANASSIITVTKVVAEAFDEFLQLFYLELCQFSTENISQVLLLVDNYYVDGGFWTCEQFMAQTISIGVAYNYYELAVLYNLSNGFKSTLETFISQCERPKEIFDMMVISDESLFFVFPHMLQTFNWECNEYELLQAMISWATKSLIYKEMSASMVNLRLELSEYITEIRFPLMTMQQFLLVIETYKQFLNVDEIIDILHYISDGRPLTVAAKFKTVPRIRDGDHIFNTTTVDDNDTEMSTTYRKRVQFKTGHFQRMKKLIGISIEVEAGAGTGASVLTQQSLQAHVHLKAKDRIIFSSKVIFLRKERNAINNKRVYTYTFDIPFVMKPKQKYELNLITNNSVCLNWRKYSLNCKQYLQN